MIKFLDFTELNGLVSCAKPASAKNNAEILYLIEASKLGVEAVFFRRFYQDGARENRNILPFQSEPAVCLFKVEEDAFFNSEEHKVLHAALWSAGKNEVYVLMGKTRVDIVNARRPAPVDQSGDVNLETLCLTRAAVQNFDDTRFSSYLFESGTFWEQPDFVNEIDENNSPYIFLLRYLMATRNVLFKSLSTLTARTIDKLLVTCILIKFLEDIRDDNGKHSLRSIYKKHRINTFGEALASNVFLDILEDLSSEFNGKIFSQFSTAEKKDLKKSDLSKISQFLSGDIDPHSNQLFLWKQYSFKHLPPEVISAIYENFIQAESIRQKGQTEKGVVYTPIHLVNHLIDEAMPLDKPELFRNEQFKVLDPACGSGVFLVAAYKRLLQWWALNNRTDGSIQYPKSKKAQKILENNIFGVDIKETATLVSIFGLTTALLEKLSPQEIWNNLRFNDLSQHNIVAHNFFEWAAKAKNSETSFDLIIGNPPFNIEMDKTRDQVLRKSTLNQLNLNHPNIPYHNFALYFFETAALLANHVCMIIPANVLLYNKATQKYRMQIFKNYTVKKIFDFTHLRRDLFHRSADTPVVAVIMDSTPSGHQDIEHYVVKRMVSSEKKIRFEIDYYDRHVVKWNWAMDEARSFVWKTNLLGGGRLFQLISRLSLLPTLQDHILSNPGWTCQRGFEGGNGMELKNQNQIVGISKKGNVEIAENITITTANLKDKGLYKPPFLVFEQILGDKNIPTAIVTSENLGNKKHLFFKRDFIGLKVPDSSLDELQHIHERFRKTSKKQLNFQLYVLATSSNCLILHETAIRQGDLLDVPFSHDDKSLALSEAESHLQDDVLNYYIHLGKSISIQGAANKLHAFVSDTQLIGYGKSFCLEMNGIYSKNGKSWQAGVIYRNALYTVYQFGFGPDNALVNQVVETLDENMMILLQDKLSNSGTIYTRVVRLYSHVKGYDCVYLIKPNAIRYWLHSIALRDADDTFYELAQEGY
jgi:type I restriction-modification system DNA methylase subunit